MRISEFIKDETLNKVGPDYIWLWVTIEPDSRDILPLSISKERSKFVAVGCISNLIKHGKLCVSTDDGMWYPQDCRFLKLNHDHLHSTIEKNLNEQSM